MTDDQMTAIVRAALEPFVARIESVLERMEVLTAQVDEIRVELGLDA